MHLRRVRPARQAIVLEQDSVLQRLVPVFVFLSLGYQVIWSSADVRYVVTLHPFRQVVGDV